MSLHRPPGGVTRLRLIRLLAEREGGTATEGGSRLAAKLGNWLDLGNAISLAAALNAPAAAEASPAGGGALAEMQAAFERLRSGWVDAINGAKLPRQGKCGPRLPAALLAADPPASFASYHRYYTAMQVEMDKSIRPFRAALRQALAGLSQPAASLATLDATLEAALAGRERALLAGVPQWLADRFRDSQGDAADDRFRELLRELLLAELELRLLPVAGLLGALAQQAAACQSAETALPATA